MNPGLPNNVEAEKSLLGSIFWSSYALQRACEELSSEVFFLDSHAKIFECICELYNKHQPVDVSTVTSLMVEKNIVNLFYFSCSLAHLLRRSKERMCCQGF